ncbi:hypothetical protein GCM10025785_00430 [Corynebacterium canis]
MAAYLIVSTSCEFHYLNIDGAQLSGLGNGLSKCGPENSKRYKNDGTSAGEIRAPFAQWGRGNRIVTRLQ